MAKSVKRQKRGKLAAALEETAHDPKRRAVAASALAAGGAIAAGGKLVRDRVAERDRRKRAQRYRLEPGESPREGIRRVARGQLDLSIGLLEDGRGHAEAIHEARKALKRLRAALRITRGSLGSNRYRHENVILRDAGRALSGSRDAQVLLERLDELAERHAGELDGSAWKQLRHALESSAETGDDGKAAASVVGALSDARVRVGSWPLPAKGGPEALAPGLQRIYRRGRRALHVAQQEPSTENLHELRKRVKDLWHAAQLLRSTAPNQMKKLARRAHHVSDLLGEDHDLAVLMERARAQSGLLTPVELEKLTRLIAHRRKRLQQEALKRAGRLYKRKPGKLARAVAA
jgi:CHAD domain-containing protein